MGNWAASDGPGGERLVQGRIDLGLLRGQLRPQFRCLRLNRLGLLRQRPEVDVDRILIEHGGQLLVLELDPLLGQVANLVAHGLKVATRRAGRGVDPGLDAVAPRGQHGDLLFQRSLRGRELAPACLGPSASRLDRWPVGPRRR